MSLSGKKVDNAALLTSASDQTGSTSEGYQDMGSHLERRHILYVIRHIENGETGGQTKHARPLKWTLIKRTESPSLNCRFWRLSVL